MAVINSTLTEIGDQIIFTMEYPIKGIEAITGYTEGTTGVTGTRLFGRDFRYTLDGINFTEWITLTELNLQAIPIAPEHEFQAQFRYTREGTDDTGNLTFKWLRLDYDTTVNCAVGGSYFDGSIFSYFLDCACEDIQTKKWAINVLNKVYKPGVVSKSMTRGENRNLNFEDEDYIAFWNTVTCFFAMHVNYARGFEQLPNDQRLLLAYLTNQAYIPNRDQSVADLQEVMKNIYAYMRHRGTPSIGNLKSRGATIDGELPNLVQYDEVRDEFLLDYSKLIWQLDRHSPMYKGIDLYHCRKSYQRSINDLGETGLDNYPILPNGTTEVVNTGDILSLTPSIDGSADENVIRISGVLDGQKGGIGFVDGANPTDLERETLTSVDPRLTYEISFLAKGAAPFSVGAYGFSSSGAQAAVDTVSPGVQTNYAITKQKLANPSQWYYVRVLIQPGGAPFTGEEKTSLGIGWNLRMPEIVTKLGFEISVDRTDSSSNQDPTVLDNTISIQDSDLRILRVEDFINGLNDVEGDPPTAIRIDGISVASGTGTYGALTWDGVNIQETLPQTIPLEDIANELLTYKDTAGDVPQDIEIDFQVLDNQPQPTSDFATLLIKDVTFKLATRPYGVGVVNGVNLVETWVRNRSGRAEDEINQIIKQSLLPYNVRNKNNFLSL